MIKILSKKLKEIIKKTKKEIKKQIIKEIKKEFLDEQIKTNQDIKDEIKKNNDLYDTKMIMFKTFGVSNDIYNEFYNYSLIMREFKNELSKTFYDHFYDILRKDFIQIDLKYKTLKTLPKYSKIYPKNYQDAYRDVKAMYQSMISNNFIWSKKQKTLSYLTKFYSADLKQFLSDTDKFNWCQGHGNAFGFEIDAENIKATIDICNTECESCDKNILVDFAIDYSDFNVSMIADVHSLEDYYGTGIKEPTFYISNIPLEHNQGSILGKTGSTWKFITDDNIAIINIFRFCN